MKAATVICQQIFSILALVIFLLKILLKNVSKSSCFRFGLESGFGAAIPVCKSFSVRKGASLCKSFCVCKRLPCVKALCVMLCVEACCV